MGKTRLILAGAAGSAVLCLILMSLVDPTRADQVRLDDLQAISQHAPRLSAQSQKLAYSSDLDVLVQKPVFVMTTGAGAYAEKTLQVYGISISPSRKAALVSIAGANPVWIRTGEVSGDIELSDVDASGASFDTPLGERRVGLNDPAPSGTSSSTSAGSTPLASSGSSTMPSPSAKPFGG